MRVTCDREVQHAELMLGNNSQRQYIFERGYVLKNGSWKELTFGGTNKAGQWWRGSATVTINHDQSALEATQHVVAYICTYVDGGWKCGCRDSACTQGYWQLQSYRFPEEDQQQERTSRTITAQQGERVALAVGDTAVVDDLSLMLAAITGDNRCPSGVQCIIAGSVKARIEISVAGAAGQAHAIEQNGDAVVANGYHVSLVDAEPPAVEGQQIAEDEYELTFTVQEEEGASDTAEDGEGPQTHTFDLNAFNYAFSEEELRVQKGDTVRIAVTSTRGYHDLVIDRFGVRTDRLNTDESDSIEFVADEAGEFPYYCSVGNHRRLGMEGTLIVEE